MIPAGLLGHRSIGLPFSSEQTGHPRRREMSSQVAHQTRGARTYLPQRSQRHPRSYKLPEELQWTVDVKGKKLHRLETKVSKFSWGKEVVSQQNTPLTKYSKIFFYEPCGIDKTTGISHSGFHLISQVSEISCSTKAAHFSHGVVSGDAVVSSSMNVNAH